MVRTRALLAALSVFLVAGCGSEEEPLGWGPHVELPWIEFQTAVTRHGMLYAGDEANPVGWAVDANSWRDPCRHPGTTGDSYLTVVVHGNPAGGCVVAPPGSEPEAGCTGYVLLGHQLDADRRYVIHALSGLVSATFEPEGAMAWTIDVRFRDGALSPVSCDGGDQLTGDWTCLAADGATTLCDGDCAVEPDASCCAAGTATAPLRLSFVTHPSVCE